MRFIERSLTCLQPQGVMIVVLRSRESQWWKLLDSVMETVKNKRLDTHVFAEDFITTIASTHPNMSVDSVDFNVSVNDFGKVIRLVEFLYRLPENSVSHNKSLCDSIQNSLEQQRDGNSYSIGFRDIIVSIGQTKP